jgi:hypothetical protein
MKEWKYHVLPKRQLTFNGLHGVISKKIELIITTAVRTSHPTQNFISFTSCFILSCVAKYYILLRNCYPLLKQKTVCFFSSKWHILYWRNNRFSVYLITFYQLRSINSQSEHKWWNEKNLEGSGRGLFAGILACCLWGLRKGMENLAW